MILMQTTHLHWKSNHRMPYIWRANFSRLSQGSFSFADSADTVQSALTGSVVICLRIRKVKDLVLASLFLKLQTSWTERQICFQNYNQSCCERRDASVLRQRLTAANKTEVERWNKNRNWKWASCCVSIFSGALPSLISLLLECCRNLTPLTQFVKHVIFQSVDHETLLNTRQVVWKMHYSAMPEIVCVCPFLLRDAFPMVLVANKVDLVHLRKITADQGQEMAAKHNVSNGPHWGHLALNWYHIFNLNRVFTCAWKYFWSNSERTDHRGVSLYLK